MRPSGRDNNQLRETSFALNPTKYAEGSCLIRCGDTHVLCTASVDEKVPPFMRGSGLGWVTAEYGMLPRSTHSRMNREAAQGKQSGRTQEIQRLIGRALRTAVDRKKMGEIQIKIDCDVLQADGGTRTASITGAMVALDLAFRYLMKIGKIKENPIIDSVAAVSCGIVGGEAKLDLDYIEDSNAETDANFVMTGSGNIVEIQGTAEKTPFTKEQMIALLDLAAQGVAELTACQKEATKDL